MIVKLSFEEGLSAATQGVVQMMRAKQNGWVGADHGGSSGRDERERWAQAIHGQLCEHAVAKALNLFPSASVDGIQHGDFGGICAVRGTPWQNGHLIINGAEADPYADTPFILVVGHWPDFRIAGWIYGREATFEKWWRPNERPPSWWVPQSALLNIENTLDKLVSALVKLASRNKLE